MFLLAAASEKQVKQLSLLSLCFIQTGSIRSYEDAVRNAVSPGGDSDTIACIAGGIAQVFYKSIPESIPFSCVTGNKAIYIAPAFQQSECGYLKQFCKPFSSKAYKSGTVGVDSSRQ
ncbi:ADP-ribosylglycohydrolase family protein [Pontibacter brevis]